MVSAPLEAKVSKLLLLTVSQVSEIFAVECDESPSKAPINEVPLLANW